MQGVLICTKPGSDVLLEEDGASFGDFLGGGGLWECWACVGLQPHVQDDPTSLIQALSSNWVLVKGFHLSYHTRDV